MTIFEKLGFKDKKDFLYNWGQNTEEIQEVSETLFSGTVDRSAVYPRLIMEKVFKYSARSVVFAHNHPSGDCKPSVKDVELTNQIKDCFRLLDVTVLDHVIISKNEYFSFLEEGII